MNRTTGFIQGVIGIAGCSDQYCLEEFEVFSSLVVQGVQKDP